MVSRVRVLNQVSQIIDIEDPEIVKTWLADTQNEHHYTKPCTWSILTKKKFVTTETTFLDYLGKTWKHPKYKAPQKLRFIPTEEEINILIAASSPQLAAVLEALKETGMRIGELTQLMPSDLDPIRKTLTITPEKNSNPRIRPITDRLINMIATLRRSPQAQYKTLFQPHQATLRGSLIQARKQAAIKFNNPRLNQITFHTFRRWKGTTEQHKFHDIYHVQKVLGHKSVKSTEIYIQLEEALYLQTDDSFICKVAHDEKEEAELIETGFEHINNRDNLAFYRKRK